jgi:indole-3-glycerol phosphate synthase
VTALLTEIANARVASLTPPAEPRTSRLAPHAFRDALRRSDRGLAVIAEVKGASPSAGTIVASPDVEAIAGDYQEGGAAAVSVVTEPEFFAGSPGWISRAAAAGLPVLMKDFITRREQLEAAIATGADAVLLIAALLDRAVLRGMIERLEAAGRDALVEVHDEGELESALDAGASIVGVNNRDLRDFSVDLATGERLVASIPPEVVRVAESGIRTPGDAERLAAAGFDAVLVGESLLRAADRRSAVAALAGVPRTREAFPSTEPAT